MGKTTSGQGSAKTAAQLMQELQSNPAYQAQMEGKTRSRIEANAVFAHEEQRIVTELAMLGYKVATLDELRRAGFEYKSAIPVLLKSLKSATNLSLKEALVRSLSVPWAKPKAIPVLLEEFASSQGNPASLSLGWAIGNALEVLADDAYAQELINIACNKRYGKSREMVVVALAKLSTPLAETALKELLNDEAVAGHAVLALSRRPGPKALTLIRPFLQHPQEWVRDAAQKSISGH
jgi:HEAT repeat protein